MQQPALTWHVVVAIARTYTDVRHLQFHLLIPIKGGVLTHARRCQEETAGRAPLDVALRESGGIRKATAIEDVEGIQVQRFHRQHTIGQFDAIHAIIVVPACEVLGILINDIKAKAPAITVEIQLEVTVLAHQFGRIERRTERKAEVADTHTERRFPIGFHLCLEMMPTVGRTKRRSRLIDTFGLNLRSRHIHSRRNSPFRCRPRNISRVDIALTISQCQQAVNALKEVLRKQR